METEFPKKWKPASTTSFVSDFKTMSYQKTQMETATNGETCPKTRLSFHFVFCSKQVIPQELEPFEAETMLETHHNHPLRGCTGASQTPPDTPRRRRDIETLRHQDQEKQNEAICD